MRVVAPVVLGFRRGKLRDWCWLWWLLVALAMVQLGGGPGLLAGLALLGLRYLTYPAQHGAVVYVPAPASTSAKVKKPTPCLWLDPQRVVLGAPYRVIYRDELQPADFARLRRLCLGLPV